MGALRLAARNAREADCITPEHGWDAQFSAALDSAVEKLGAKMRERVARQRRRAKQEEATR